MAVFNVSNSEKTIKGMYSLLKSDNYTIDKTLLYTLYKDRNVQIAFKLILTDYWDYLSSNLVEIDLPKEFYYSPSGFSQFYYDTPDFDFLVLFFSQTTSLLDFNKPKIKVFPKEKILELNKLFIHHAVDVEESYTNPKFYQ